MNSFYRPTINAKGYKNAVKDYNEESVIEELAANSYDEDATTVVVLLNTATSELWVIDDGSGFDEEKIRVAATLGGGDKASRAFSTKKRNYLGSYGVGLKSTLNIAKSVQITSVSTQGKYETLIEWSKLDEILANDHHKGFDFRKENRPKNSGNGTCIKLKLSNPTDKTHLEKFGRVLTNLPSDNGKFSCFFGAYQDLAPEINEFFTNFKGLSKLAEAAASEGKLCKATNSREQDLENCQVKNFSNKDENWRATVYFAGMEGDKVKHLKSSLRGIYVRVHGRLLKHNFAEQDYTYNISRYMKFASALRVEFEVDWLRDQITLSRDGLSFSNDKLQNDFKKIVQQTISQFIAPKLKAAENKKAKQADKLTDSRRQRVEQRLKTDTSHIVPSCKGAAGFKYVPETDAELAILLAAQPQIIKDAGGWELLDYNDQGSFDCIFHNRKAKEIIQVELEPTLHDFLGHNNKKGIELIVCWSRGKWKVGTGKKGKPGFLVLKDDKDKGGGFYQLLEHASEKSKEPRFNYPVLIVEEFLK